MPRNGSFEAEYKTQKNYWGKEPSAVIKDNVDRLQGKTVLDIGAGDGRNALFLAKKGFHISALDLSATGLSHLMDEARQNSLEESFTTTVSDFMDYESLVKYDNVITNFTIHFVGADKINAFLEKMMVLTAPGGINIIDDFTRNGPLAEDHPDMFITQDMIENFYHARGWHILLSENRLVKPKKYEYSDESHMHEALSFIAQKI